MSSRWQTQWNRGIDSWLVWLIPWFLAVDCLNGALTQTLGSSFALSLVFKTSLLLLMLLSLGLLQPARLWWFVVGLAALMLGPIVVFVTNAAATAGNLHWLLTDLQLAVKLLSPLLAFFYFVGLQQRSPQAAWQLLRRTFVISGLVLLLNILAGIAGFGFTAYQPLDGVAQSFLGIKGFFYSANELAAVLVLITAVLLTLSWPQSLRRYGAISVTAIVSALLLLTKTGLLGTLLLVLAIPLLYQTAQFWHANKSRLVMLAFACTLLMLLLWWFSEPLLRGIGLYDKLTFVYQQRGISGILLSSRDYYAEKILLLYSSQFSDWQQLLGVGQGAMALQLKKYFAELDWFDLFIFHGVAGVLLFVSTFLVFIAYSWRMRKFATARCMLWLHLLLLAVASIAGHIMTSGVLWLPWALAAAVLTKGKPAIEEPA